MIKKIIKNIKNSSVKKMTLNERGQKFAEELQALVEKYGINLTPVVNLVDTWAPPTPQATQKTQETSKRKTTKK